MEVVIEDANLRKSLMWIEIEEALSSSENILLLQR